MKYLLPFFLFLSSLSAIGQNLVPNFSFEDYSSCPMQQDQVHFSNGWFKCSDDISTPDYYNACSPESLAGVPRSFFFYQDDARLCNSYMGLVTWSPAQDREYIGIELNNPLEIGQKYYLSFKTVMGGSYASGAYYDCPSNNIGIRLSTVPYSESNPSPITNMAHLRTDQVLTDTVNWTQVFGSIVVDSSYRYLMLGNFFDNANTDTITLSCIECFNAYSYYLVDDICVSTDSTFCMNGVGQLPCNVSISDEEPSRFNVYPNPINDLVNIRFGKTIGQLKIAVHNAFGQLIFKKTLPDFSSRTIDLSHASNGLLLLTLEYENQSLNYKLLKQ